MSLEPTPHQPTPQPAKHRPRRVWVKSPLCTFCDAAGNYMGTENLCPCGHSEEKK